MDNLLEIYNKETHLRNVGIFQSASVLATCSMVARHTIPVPLSSSLVAPPATHGESVGLHCDHCGQDGHVETFYYSNRKAQKARALAVLHRVLVVLVVGLLYPRYRRPPVMVKNSEDDRFPPAANG
jgi:hypothetical protein